jgi:hypothetical protein
MNEGKLQEMLDPQVHLEGAASAEAALVRLAVRPVASG